MASINIPSLTPPANAAVGAVAQSALAINAGTPVTIADLASAERDENIRSVMAQSGEVTQQEAVNATLRTHQVEHELLAQTYPAAPIPAGAVPAWGQQILNGLNALQGTVNTTQGTVNTLQGTVNTLQAGLPIEFENVSIRSGNRMIGQTAQLHPLKKSVPGDGIMLANNLIPAHPLNPLANVPALGSTPPGSLFPPTKDAAMRCTTVKIKKIIQFYNSDLGIVAGDSLHQKRLKLHAWTQ